MLKLVELFCSVDDFFKEFLPAWRGIQFIDSTSISVCHYKRISGTKSFDHEGNLVSCKITSGNTDDRVPVLQLAKNISGKLFGDKGYISQELVDQLFAQGVQLMMSVQKNMKNKFMPLKINYSCEKDH